MNLRGVVVGNRYTIEREIGRGGMATVWLAHDAQHARRIAIKTLHPELAGAIGTDRFLREIRLTAELQHPGVVPILDSGAAELDGMRIPWYAMPFLEGETLRSRLTRETQLPIDEALRITAGVGKALVAAHHRNIVHRDIKPENVFLSGEQVYVVDFGVAKAIADTEVERLTSTGLAIGTPTYMSPEQALAGPIDARSDQYSLAVMLYEMLAGEPPFAGPNQQATIARRLAERARPISTVRSTVPRIVEHATLRALERTPADRFPSVDAFLAALTSSPTSTRVRQWSGRSWIAPAAGVLIVAASGGLWVATRGPRRHVVDPEVVALYERGVRGYETRTPEGVAEAVTTLRTAIERDSLYAAAFNALAKAYARAYQRGFLITGTNPDQLLRLGLQAVNRSLELDANSPDAWATHALLSQQVDPTNLDPPLRSIRKSLAMDSSVALPWHYFALFLAESGNMDSAIAAWRRSVRVDPAYTQSLAFLSLAHYWRADFDSAQFWSDSALRVEPNYYLARSTDGFVALERGDIGRAESSMAAAEKLVSDVERINTLAMSALVKARAGRPGLAMTNILVIEVTGAAYKPFKVHTVVYLAQAKTAAGDTAGALQLLSDYQPRRDMHFQLHIRCDPPFERLGRSPRFRGLLVMPRPDSGKGC